MSVMMDVVFATILGAVVTLITINANHVINQTSATYHSDVRVQQMLINAAQVVESEFRNIGCGVSNPKESKVIEALDTSITFKMAYRPEPDAKVYVIKYFTGTPDQLTGTDNPYDRFLYREADDGKGAQKVGVVTKFSIKYFDFINDTLPAPVSDPGEIGIIEITMEVQSPSAAFIDEDGVSHFTSALWKQTRLASQNLRR